MIDRSGRDAARSNPATLSPVLARLFPPGVAAAELRIAGDVALLAPSERAACAAFAPKRAAEFAAGRLCARRALAALGSTVDALDVNADRSPRWPAGFVGSITHTAGFCAAVAADVVAFGGLGIDAERIGRITPEMHRLLFTASETEELQRRDATSAIIAATVIFSVKEAFYKAQFGLTRAWRDFTDASVAFASSSVTSGDVRLDASAESAIDDWGIPLPAAGRFLVEDDLVIAGVWLPRA